MFCESLVVYRAFKFLSEAVVCMICDLLHITFDHIA